MSLLTKASASAITTLMRLGAVGILIIGLGVVGAHYMGDLISPEVIIVKPASSAPQLTNSPVAAIPAQVELPPTSSRNSASATGSASSTDAVEVIHALETEAASKTAAHTNAIKHKEIEGSAAQLPASSRKPVAPDLASQATLQLTSRTPVASVDPILLSAYQAFNRGDDVSAQQQYRQVLQRDVRNIDALLGMAAIAQRQEREADAIGWYQKVLEIEPRNTIAQSAIVRSQVNGDVIGAESHIKNLLAQQPEAANLHATLGNLYAEQNKWASAQEAYFNASRFAPNSADYAFNLAISLDQLGKSSLALAQYQRALALLNSSGASTPDKAQLETRIQALQASN